MTTQFPAKIDDNTSLPDSVDNVTPVKAEVVNRLKEAIIAIQTELGTKPAGNYANVKTRLLNIEQSINNLQIIQLDGDLGGSLTNPLVVGLQGNPISSTAPSTNQILSFNGLAWTPSNFSFGGDLTGTRTSQTVIGLRGISIDTTAPTTGQALVYDGTKWKPGTSTAVTFAGDLSGTSTSQTVIGLRGVSVSSTSPTNGQVLGFDGSAWKPTTTTTVTFAGDLSGTSSTQTVTGLQSRAVASTAPTNGYVLGWNSIANKWQPTAPTSGGLPPGYINFEDYGGVPDWDGTTGTDNLAAWNSMMAAIRGVNNYGSIVKIIANGLYYFSDTLEIETTIVLEGTGFQEPFLGPIANLYRSAPGTMFIFPANTTGIRVRSTNTDDGYSDGYFQTTPNLTPYPAAFKSGDKTQIKNLTIFCKDAPDPVTNSKGHGIHFTVTVALESVRVSGFANHGIFGNGSFSSIIDGNVDGSYLAFCIVDGCGMDGFHLQGADATGCAIIGCQAYGCYRYGFFDYARVNSYTGCLAQNNGAVGLPAPIGGDGYIGLGSTDGGYGAEYHTEGVAYNNATFVGCYAEASFPHSNKFLGPINIFGGTLASQQITSDSTEAFVLNGGRNAFAPFAYNNFRADQVFTSQLGGTSPGYDEAFSFNLTNHGDYNMLRYASSGATQGWWSLENTSIYRHSIRFPSNQAIAKSPAPWLPNGMLLGTAGGTATTPILVFSSPVTPGSIPATQAISLPQTYEQSDYIWSSNIKVTSALGMVCLSAGTQGTLTGITADTNITDDDTNIFNVSSMTNILAGEYVSIAGVTGTKQIIRDPVPDYTVLSLTAFLRGNFNLSPWVGVSSAGTSGSNNATETGAPSSREVVVGNHDAIDDGALNYKIPVFFKGTAASKLIFDDHLSDYITGSADSGSILFNANTPIAADAGIANPHLNSPIISSNPSSLWGVSFSDAGVDVWRYDGSYKTVRFACSDSAYHLIQWYYDGTNLHARLDGETWSSTAVTSGFGGAVITTENMVLGANDYANSQFKGFVLDIQITNTALTIKQLNSIMYYINDRYIKTYGGTSRFTIDSAASATVTTAALNFVNSAFVPFWGAVNGQASFSVTGGDHTVTDTEVSYNMIKVTGTPGTTRTATFPAPSGDATAYQRTIRNTSDSSLIVSTGTGTTITIGTLLAMVCIFDTGGVSVGVGP